MTDFSLLCSRYIAFQTNHFVQSVRNKPFFPYASQS